MSKDFFYFTYIVAANLLLPTEMIPSLIFTTIALFILTDTVQCKKSKRTTEQ
jgi:hypothetical protein